MPHHIADDHQLLVVLLAEHGHAPALRLGEHAGKQLHHHSADTDEKAGAKVAFQDVGQFGWRMHLVALGLWVELFLVGSKQQVTAGGLQLFAIRAPGARIGVKVFMRQELQAVDEDAGHRDVAQRFGLANQRQMAVMQVAHGGHKSGVLELRQMLAQLGDGVDDFHSTLRDRP